MSRYKAERRLARGMVAEVLLARDTRENVPVVVKRLLPDFANDADLIALFEREIAIARKLEHPNVVRILDVGRAGKAPFYVMEFLQGMDLRQAMLSLRKLGGHMTVAAACFIGAGVARALTAAHALGILHRDIKPANVFLGNDGVVRVLDFGIATSAEHVVLTRTGVARGTRAYMAPEQQLGLALDPRTDIFALGIVLWEALTSRRLFKRDTDEATTHAIVNEPAPTPVDHAKGIPPRVEAIVMASLSKLIATRPPAKIVADVLDADGSALVLAKRKSAGEVPLPLEVTRRRAIVELLAGMR